MGRKNGSGNGSIYKYKDRWRGQIIVGDKRLSKTAKTKKEIYDWFSEIRVSYNIGTLVFDNDITVKKLAELWFENIVEPRVSEQTLYKTEKLFEDHLYPVLGDVRVQSLDKNIIERSYDLMFNKKKGKNYKQSTYCDSTIKLFASKFKACLKYGVELNIINKNPHDGVVLKLNKTVKTVDAYTADEQQKIVEYTRNGKPRDWIYYLLISTGMRVGEAIALTWDDVNLKDGTIKISKTAVNLRGHMIVQDHPKTAKSVRTIYLSPNTTQFLKKVKISQRGSNNRLNLVMPNAKYNLYHTSALRSHWVKICNTLDVEYRGIHSLRHSWATRALEKGVDIKTVSDLLGHSSVVTTMNTYQNVYAEQKRKAADMLNDVV